ncbi:hypothetical protein F7725_025666 [Dissostichus mawsoni]|uniref:Uncharacterized protein n=1 Tax=Dissostichus mawsoni TaxID=36200 RepID=A0A7J5XBR2_DISMA|nr:hypothetical protein F7725_025666 [Dissostichus mawsoni]
MASRNEEREMTCNKRNGGWVQSLETTTGQDGGASGRLAEDTRNKRQFLLRLLQLLQSGGQPLLSSVQLLLHQLDASVQGGHLCFSLSRHGQDGS